MTPRNFVLVPGAGGSAWYWHRLVTELEGRDHRAFPVTLPAGDDAAGLDEYAIAIREVVAGLDSVVLVAQSLGGLSAPLACDHDSVEMLLLVNAMVPLPGETGFEWWANTRQAEARAGFAAGQGRAVTDDMFEDFFHDVPADVVAEAIRLGEPPQSTAPMATPWPLPSWPDVPIRVLIGRDDRFFPADFQRRVARERLGIEAVEIPGGHLVALSRPVELAAALIEATEEVGTLRSQRL